MNSESRNLVLLFYLLFAYFIPALVNWVLGYESQFYRNPESGFVTWIYGAVLFIVVLIFSLYPVNQFSVRTRYYSFPERIRSFPVKFISIFILLLFLVAIIGSASGFSKWRYSKEGLSSSLNLVELMFVIIPNILELLLFILIFIKIKILPIQKRWILFLVTSCMLMTSTGISTAITSLIGFVAFVAPNQVHNLIFQVNKAESSVVLPIRIIQMIIFAIFCMLLVVVAYLFGESIKTGEDLFDMFGSLEDRDLNVFINYLIGRLSVNWYSLTVSLHEFVDLGKTGQVDNLLAPFSSAWFRFVSLTGGVD